MHNSLIYSYHSRLTVYVIFDVTFQFYMINFTTFINTSPYTAVWTSSIDSFYVMHIKYVELEAIPNKKLSLS